MKLAYFDIRGLAETSRILLALGNEEYEDFRYPLKVIDMTTYKMEKEEFDNDKKEGKLVGSLNKLPYLEIDNVIIPQSKSIERFLARRYNLMGNSEIEAAKIDSICECVRDFKDMYQKVRKTEGEEKDNEMKKWFSETLVERLELLEQSIDSKDFCVGCNLSLADIVLFTFITDFFDDKDSAFKSTETTPKIRNIIEYVSNLERIKNWIEKRPNSVF
tara:strand:+ start:5330 stop:5980 length:651 start_codon:yes stop_codon:yes gene_type:complete